MERIAKITYRTTHHTTANFNLLEIRGDKAALLTAYKLYSPTELRELAAAATEAAEELEFMLPVVPAATSSKMRKTTLQHGLTRLS